MSTVAKLMRRHGFAAKARRKELVHDEDYPSRAAARASVFEYIEVFSDRVRRHSALRYQSPAEYERAA